MSLSVLISVYNHEKSEYFDTAMNSIWDDQILKPNEIVLVQDGAINSCLSKIIEKWKSKLGDVLKLILLENNVGLTQALNEGLEYCTCDYIARMDTDDISLPNRFEKQLKYMKNNDIDMCGSNALLIDNEGSITGEKKVTEDITFHGLIKNCDVIHPSTMFKKSFFKRFGRFNSKYIHSQDYELWLRAAKQGAIIKNINESLIKFRISNEMIIRRKNEQKFNIMLKKKYVTGLKFYISILPNLAILLFPVFFLNILFNIKNR